MALLGLPNPYFWALKRTQNKYTPKHIKIAHTLTLQNSNPLAIYSVLCTFSMANMTQNMHENPTKKPSKIGPFEHQKSVPKHMTKRYDKKHRFSIQHGPNFGPTWALVGSLRQPSRALPQPTDLWWPLGGQRKPPGTHWGPQNEPQERLQSSKRLPKISKQRPQK